MFGQARPRFQPSWWLVLSVVVVVATTLGCRTTQQARTERTTEPAAGRAPRESGYLAGQAAGMAAEDAARVKATTTRPARRPRRPAPFRTRRRSPVDQPRIR